MLTTTAKNEQLVLNHWAKAHLFTGAAASPSSSTHSTDAKKPLNSGTSSRF
jgi:hypothetical protein